VRIAFVGKGGSGKTTLASLMVAHLVAGGHDVLAIDADINQHLATALGLDEEVARALPALGDHLAVIKGWLRGDNPRFSAEEMIKTTPPGAGSRLLGVTGDNPVYDACTRPVAGARLAVTGPFATDDVGVACYHGKVGAADLVLSHLVDRDDEYVVVDSTAGADPAASGLFARFDLVAVVLEPTLRSVGVWHQLDEHADGLGANLVAVGNKVADVDDVDFLRAHVGDRLVATLSHSGHVRASERGDNRPVDDLEPENRAALATLQDRLDATERDWAELHRRAVDLHRRNAAAWANDKVGSDLGAQVDPDFVPAPPVAAADA
jgi:CO dehydrogenase maturation factor